MPTTLSGYSVAVSAVIHALPRARGSRRTLTREWKSAGYFIRCVLMPSRTSTNSSRAFLRDRSKSRPRASSPRLTIRRLPDSGELPGREPSYLFFAELGEWRGTAWSLCQSQCLCFGEAKSAGSRASQFIRCLSDLFISKRYFHWRRWTHC